MSYLTMLSALTQMFRVVSVLREWFAGMRVRCGRDRVQQGLSTT